jgi:hypothetical protein
VTRYAGFSVYLFVVLLLAFLWIDCVVEGVVRNNAIEIAAKVADNALLGKHWLSCAKNPNTNEPGPESAAASLHREVTSSILALGQDAVTWDQVPKGIWPSSDHEKSLVRTLRVQWEKSKGLAADDESAVQFVLRDRERRAYDFYRPIVWAASCRQCHQPATARDGAGSPEPFRVLKVTIPCEHESASLNAVRSLVFTAGILTVCAYAVGVWLFRPLPARRDASTLTDLAASSLQQTD